MHYPVAIKKTISDTNYTFTVVDIPGCQVKVDNIEKGFEVLKQAMEQHLSLLAEYGEEIPQAKTIEYHLKLASDPTIVWAMIEFDITPFLGKSHKINVTLPELLIKKIDAQVATHPNYATRSGFIATACINELAKIRKNRL